MSDNSGFQVGQSAPSFYDAHVWRLMAPFVEALVDRTVSPGCAVLDVACGTGFATRAAAVVAGPGARVDGADLNAAMVAEASARQHDSGAEIRWREASALDLPYPNDTFDTVICQQGLQFFPDPAAGVREMARVGRDGGVVGVTVWSSAPGSPFLDRETAMLAQTGSGSQAEYSATADEVLGWFVEGGLPGASIELITVDVDLPPVLTYAPEHLKALPWSKSFFALPDDDQRRALHELDDALSEYRSADGLRVPFNSHMATARIAR